LNDDGKKQPFFIKTVEHEVHGYAGLWDSSMRDDGTVIESFTIITLPANSMMAEIHNAADEKRMPVILDRKDYEAWLSGTVDEARAVIKQYPADSTLAWPVSTRVNAPKNNDATLIEAIST
jgi:putative SOS response-associated peptidase YedK